MNKLTISSDAPGARMFMLGNEALARGAVEAGVQVVAAYPGTPSSEVTETLAGLAKDLGIYVEWSVNEKVAFEVALGASLCGQRALACMKHVGLNVAHEPMMMASYIGAIGPLVLLVADDPSAWSSQNEQDSRFVAEQGYWPVLEPSSVAEAREMMADAFTLSKRFEHPFMIRPVTRISHGRSDVALGAIETERPAAAFKKDPARLVYTPAQARRNKPLMLARFGKIAEAVNEMKYNQLKLVKGAKLGIIASGLPYSYTLEALNWLGLQDDVPVLKIGTPNPLPEKLVRQMLESVSEVLIVEELDPFVENHVLAIVGRHNIPVKIHGKDLIPVVGEISTRIVTEVVAGLMKKPLPLDFTASDKLGEELAGILPSRPPTLCPGCPHRASQYAMKVAGRRAAKRLGKDVQAIFPGDIGCYTLSYLPPLESMDTTICMGASFGVGNGLAQVSDAPVIAQLGDSTFFHSGMAALVNAVFNKANLTMVVLDNSATAMTGFQPHPGTGRTAVGDPAPKIKPEDVAKACGVEFIEIVDPFDVKNTIAVLERAIQFEGPSLVVSRQPCAVLDLRDKKKRGEAIVPLSIDQKKCDQCEVCIKLLGCPAILKDGRVVINEALCTGCGLCAQICPHEAIG